MFLETISKIFFLESNDRNRTTAMSMCDWNLLRNLIIFQNSEVFSQGISTLKSWFWPQDKNTYCHKRKKKRITLSLVVENVIWFVGNYLHCLAPFKLIPRVRQKFESAGVNWYCRCLTWTYEYQLAGCVFRMPNFKGIIIWLSIVQCLVCTVICIL